MSDKFGQGVPYFKIHGIFYLEYNYLFAMY